MHVLNELIRSMESFNFGDDIVHEANSPVSASKYYNSSGGSGMFLRDEQRIKVVDNDVTPDFGWVNELLM